MASLWLVFYFNLFAKKVCHNKQRLILSTLVFFYFYYFLKRRFRVFFVNFYKCTQIVDDFSLHTFAVCGEIAVTKVKFFILIVKNSDFLDFWFQKCKPEEKLLTVNTAGLVTPAHLLHFSFQPRSFSGFLSSENPDCCCDFFSFSFPQYLYNHFLNWVFHQFKLS